ncbi:hypothetical protein MUP77_02035, partial [Candidatus Bathyarchaeota archaeon]|nr:hypothetical protein [Candidatus Bathyarchaeota archaeon]
RSGTVVDIQGPTAVYAITSGNPMAVTAASAGQMLVSKAVMSVTVKALSINSGDIYLGGEAAGDKPYSGCGFLLEPGEAINIDINEIGRVWACAEVSGDRLTYLGVQDA